jgi:hypothetical protein
MPNDIDTNKPTTNFGYMFGNCSSLKCITKIDTTNATSTSDMFYDASSLTAPDATDQTDIENKVNQPWINSGSCP